MERERKMRKTSTKSESGRDLRTSMVFRTDSERGRVSINCWRRFGLRGSRGSSDCEGIG